MEPKSYYLERSVLNTEKSVFQENVSFSQSLSNQVISVKIKYYGLI